MLFFLKLQKSLKTLLIMIHNSKVDSKYKTIGEVAKMLNLIDKKKRYIIYTYNSFLGKRI